MSIWLEWPQERMGGERFFFFFETALWTAFEFSFRWKVRNGVVSVGVSPEKLVLPFW